MSIMAETLAGDKAVLEEQLDKARLAHAELCKAGKKLAAAESTIRESTMQSMSNTRAETPDAEVRPASKQRCTAAPTLLCLREARHWLGSSVLPASVTCSGGGVRQGASGAINSITLWACLGADRPAEGDQREGGCTGHAGVC